MTGERDPSTDATARFAPEMPSIGAARRYAVRKLDDWGVNEQTTAAAIIVSELATNAVRHAQSDFEVRLTRRPHSVVIAVSDQSTAPPGRQEPEPQAESGFGLKIVSELSSDWGWELGERGKRVWAELDDSLTENRRY